MTLVQRPVAPELVGRPDTRGGGTTSYTDPGATCTCTDPDVHRLVGLINSGMSQKEASKLLWGDGSSTPPADAVEAAPAVAARPPAPAPIVTPTSAPGARFPWLRRAKARR